MKKLFLLFFISFLSAHTFKILQTLSLDYISFANFNFSEISDLAYDKKNQILYMISDEGILFRFRAFFDKRVHLKPLDAFYIKDKKGKKLIFWKRDSEGLTFDKKGRLFVSFEGKPRVWQIDKHGKKQKALKLWFRKRFKQRSRNKGLEALAFHPKYGLITAYEYAPKGYKKCNQVIFSLKKKKLWHFTLEPFKNCAITALEVMDNGNFLILERAYSGIIGNFVISLVEFNPKTRQKKLLYQLQSAKGDEVQNYEGLCRVGKGRYLMVSDDNDSFFASTVLVYFILYQF